MSEPRYSWTQPICVTCWDERNPDRPAVALRPGFAETETCVHCGAPHDSGIYVRVDPSTAAHPTRTKS